MLVAGDLIDSLTTRGGAASQGTAAADVAWIWALSIMLVAGLLGAAVNLALAGNLKDKQARITAVLSGVAAALLTPLFLRTVSSDLVGKIAKAKPSAEDLLVFGGFCLLAAISSKTFIESLSDKVLREVKEAKSAAVRSEGKVQAAVEGSSSAAAVAEAARDAVEYGLTRRPSKQAEQVRAEAELAAQVAEGAGDEGDPWKGRFGGSPRQNGRELTADIFRIPGRSDWRAVRLAVRSTDLARALEGVVHFHLHPSFQNPAPVVPVASGEAVLSLTCWGAFTVGAETDGGATRLELDLAQHPDADEPWRSA